MSTTQEEVPTAAPPVPLPQDEKKDAAPPEAPSKPSSAMAILLAMSTAIVLDDAVKGLKLLIADASMSGEQKAHATLALRHAEDAMSRLDRVAEVGRKEQLAARAKAA